MINLPQTHAVPTAMQLALIAAIQAAEDKPVKRPTVPDDAGQQLDTDYDGDPALEQTPMKNQDPKAKPKPTNTPQR